MTFTGERMGIRPTSQWFVVAVGIVAWTIGLANLRLATTGALSAHGTGDFQWSGARMLLHGVDAYQQWFTTKGDSFVLAQFPKYLPLLLLLLCPFGLMSFGAAKVVWLALNLTMTFVVFLWLARGVGLRGWKVFLWSGLFAASGPLTMALNNGQQTILVMFCGALALRQRHVIPTGWWLAVAVTKYSFLPIATAVVARKRWSVLAVVALLQLGAVVAFSAITGSKVADTVVAPLRVAQDSPQDSGNVTSVVGMVNPLDSHLPAYAAALVAMIVLAWFSRRQLVHGDWVDQLAVGSAISLLTLPHLIYDYSLLLALALAGLRLHGIARVLAVGPVAVIWYAWLAGGIVVILPFSMAGVVETMTLTLLALGAFVIGSNSQERRSSEMRVGDRRSDMLSTRAASAG